MIISLGHARSSSQILVKSFDFNSKTLNSKIIDVTDLVDENLSGLYYDDENVINSLTTILEKEAVFYPVVSSEIDGINIDLFEKISQFEFLNLYSKLNNRWALGQNLKSLEQIYPFTNHLKELWRKDRTSFFEELWFWLKRNLSTFELSIYFNDVISSEEKDENNEKKERPKLAQSFLKGSKKADFFHGGEKEKQLMNSYVEKFHDCFEITEFNSDKAQLVATAQIDRSPVIIMARTLQINSLQKSLLAALFNGMKN